MSVVCHIKRVPYACSHIHTHTRSKYTQTAINCMNYKHALGAGMMFAIVAYTGSNLIYASFHCYLPSQ